MTYKQRLASLVAPCLLVLPLSALAEFEYFAGSELGWMQVRVNDEDFHPILVNAHFDVRHDSGWGAALLLATGVHDDEAANVELELDRHSALFATYSASGRRVTWTFGAGYSETKLGASLNGGGYPGDSTYEGGTAFLRFTEEFETWPGWHLSLAFSSLFDNSDVDIWSANLGVQYAF